MNDWKDALGAAFGVEVPTQDAAPEPVLDPTLTEAQGKQMIDILLDKRNRKGKKVTLITNLLASDARVAELAAELKRHCGTGGSSDSGEILLQGDFREKVLAYLKSQSLKARII